MLITEYTSPQICAYKHAVTIVDLCLFYLVISMAVGNKEKSAEYEMLSVVFSTMLAKTFLLGISVFCDLSKECLWKYV
jgi:hypothetical protein